MTKVRRSIFLLLAGLLLLSAPLRAQGVRIDGCVRDARSGEAVAGALLRLDAEYLWALSDEEGRFRLQDVSPGRYRLEVSLLGYRTYVQPLSLRRGEVRSLEIFLEEESLALSEVVVTAESAKDQLNTVQTIGRTAIDHLQMNSIGGLSALLPGGKTQNPDLTTENSLSLRSGGLDAGNAAFGTAVEINGVRMGDNASFSGMAGIGTRSLSVDNIESVSVITGVPSAEYGDFGSGIVQVKTRKGRTPLNLVFSANPRTWETSVSKGFELGKGVLNLSAEWAKATSKLTSPYTSYTRRGFTADYTQSFSPQLRLEAGLSGNIGGMNSASDPDAFTDAYTEARDYLLTPHFKLMWMPNRSWITHLSIEGSVYYHDQRVHDHAYHSYASVQPAVHAEEEGYFLAQALPLTYYSDAIEDSRELDYAASLKYHWLRHFGSVKNILKAGLQWKADGNAGKGEWYEDPALAPNGYRPRPYTDYPYMHTLAAYAEENASLPIGSTTLHLMAGLRLEQAFVSGSEYEQLHMLSPRLNAKWQLSPAVAVRGGWGVSGKLPSFYILYPRPEYRDIRSVGFPYGESTAYIYYTQPYSMVYNPSLRWQKNENSEIGIDVDWRGFRMSVAAFYNLTRDPYQLGTVYEPFSYRVYSLPEGFVPSADTDYVLDAQSGALWFRADDGYYTEAPLVVEDRSFAASRRQENGADVRRSGVECTLDFPEIRSLGTTLRFDAAWNRVSYRSDIPVQFYQSGWSHPLLPNRSYPYVGIYRGGANVFDGRRTDNVDANLTAITHIPQAKLIVTLRVEAALLRNAQYTSSRAFTVSADGTRPTGGDIYAGDSYTAVCPDAYMDLDGNIHPWTADCADDPALSRLILRSGNIYTFAADGYDPWFSAHLSVTKEIGSHVSFSFFANNFTNARRPVRSRATGVSAIFTPNFYYGLTCRIKL